MIHVTKSKVLSLLPRQRLIYCPFVTNLYHCHHVSLKHVPAMTITMSYTTMLVITYSLMMELFMAHQGNITTDVAIAR